MNPHLAAIIPSFNAAATLPELLKRLRQQGLSLIVVVDDGSEDETARAARDGGATVLQHDVNRGKGAALRTGFEYLLSVPQWEAIVTLDADLQHQPEEIPKFQETLRYTNADMVIGRRRIFGTSMPWPRRASNLLTSFLVSARTGQRIRDSQCGFRLIRRSVIEHVRFDSNGYEAETEFVIRAAKVGYHIEFVPIETIYNSHRSHMTHAQTTRQFLRVLLKDYS